MRNSRPTSLAFLLLAAATGAADTPAAPEILLEREHPVPSGPMERLQKVVEHRVALLRYGDNSLLQVIDPTKVWDRIGAQQRVVIKVAFMGGNTALYRQIMEVARKWEGAGHLVFDCEVAPGQFRSWSRNDPTADPAGADIRVAFDQAGFIDSAIGTAARKISANRETMNLGGFDRALPARWQYYVLHEFGHALGLMHELQHPESTCQLRWEDDPGYVPPQDSDTQALPVGGLRPGIYTFLGSAPNHWSKSEVRQQLAIDSRPGLDRTTFDPASVMIYPLAGWLYADANSACAQERSGLSPADVAAIQRHYPATTEGREKLRQDQQAFFQQVSNLMQAELK